VLTTSQAICHFKFFYEDTPAKKEQGRLRWDRKAEAYQEIKDAFAIYTLSRLSRFGPQV